MHHVMTLWAKRLHVVDRVNILGAAQCMQRDFMMYMDKVSTELTVHIPQSSFRRLGMMGRNDLGRPFGLRGFFHTG